MKPIHIHVHLHLDDLMDSISYNDNEGISGVEVPDESEPFDEDTDYEAKIGFRPDGPPESPVNASTIIKIW